MKHQNLIKIPYRFSLLLSRYHFLKLYFDHIKKVFLKFFRDKMQQNPVKLEWCEIGLTKWVFELSRKQLHSHRLKAMNSTVI